MKIYYMIGIALILGGSVLKYFNKMYEEKYLPRQSKEFQKKYWEAEKELSEKGAYNIPFKNGKLISTGNNVHDFNNMIIILGVISFGFGFIL